MAGRSLAHWTTLLVLTATPLAAVSQAAPRFLPGEQGSRNVRVVSHLPLGAMFTVTDVEIEQELSRPFAYVSRMHGPTRSGGFSIIDLKVPDRARVLYTWRIEEPDLHQGSGGSAPTYLKSRGRYYFVQAFQWSQQGPDADLGAIVFDVTGLPDTSRIREVARLRLPESPGGFHEDFSYKHSDGRALFIATTLRHAFAHVYDIDRVAAGDPRQGLIGGVPLPDTAQYAPGVRARGYHDFYVGFDPASRQDRFYGGGAGGCYVYDITRLEQPRLLTSITGAAGMPFCHTFTPTPDGRYAVAEVEYQYAPLRIFDLQPGLDGAVKTVSRPIGAWTADWRALAHNHEVRWPYVFVSGYEDGLQIVNMMDPVNPYTVGYHYSYDGPRNRGLGAGQSVLGDVFQGAFGVDVRNADGLVVVSDMTTGFWAYRLDGFDGWNGHQWGMPNNSSAQDWDQGPDGASKPARVSWEPAW